MANILENDIVAHIGKQKYLCTVFWRNGQFIMDEPEILGGQDLGPDPYSVLLASLASCTLATLRMYIDRKGWNISEVNVSLNLEREVNSETTTITKKITFPPAISEEQKEKLLAIAEKCPISKILKGNIFIKTSI